MTPPQLTAPVVAIEGIDGAGKNTLAAALTRECAVRGLRVGRMAFPRYGEVHADLISDALHGRVTNLADSPYAMAALFALDRHAALGDLAELARTHHLVLLDRWVASSAAFTAARLGGEAQREAQREVQREAQREAQLKHYEEAFDWVRELEFGRLGLPVPALQLLLATETEVAASRAARRESADASRVRDRYERDAGLQQRTSDAYARLADSGWGSPWRVVVGEPDVERLADEMESLIGGANRG